MSGSFDDSSVSTSVRPEPVEAPQRTIMTCAAALRAAAARLAQVSDTARLDAELLMAHALGCTRSDLLLRHMQDPEPAAFAALVERRERHEPVAYITGTQEFYGLTFHVAPDVLIPRADSEATLEAALDAAPGAVRTLDCGTGSGALLLALLAERPDAVGVGIDRSAQALAIATANAASLGLEERASLQLADWDHPGWADNLGQFDLVLANPPYVETTFALAPQVSDYEPAGALFAGEDGLDAYRILIPQLPELLKAGGVAVLEIGASQAEAVSKIAAHHGFTCKLRCDLGNRPRALILRLGLGKALANS
jgi:release factor glutamine methyltransferase